MPEVLIVSGSVWEAGGALDGWSCALDGKQYCPGVRTWGRAACRRCCLFFTRQCVSDVLAVLTVLWCLSSGWKCARCDLRENLWLNLTDGSVLCGKWFFDSSGGNGHALEHYRDMGYPLAVKLGTITPDGAGECGFA